MRIALLAATILLFVLHSQPTHADPQQGEDEDARPPRLHEPGQEGEPRFVYEAVYRTPDMPTGLLKRMIAMFDMGPIGFRSDPFAREFTYSLGAPRPRFEGFAQEFSRWWAPSAQLPDLSRRYALPEEVLESLPEYVPPDERSWYEKLIDEFREHFEITGFQKISYQAGSVAGNEAAYRNDNWGLDEAYTNRAELYIRGTLFNYILVDLKISRDRFYPTEDLIKFEYERKGTRLQMGHIALSITGNSLVSFSKSVKGVAFRTPLKRYTFEFIHTKARSAAKTVTVKGENKSGPYYLGYFPIVDGSERVRIDEQEVPSDQYEINYEVGIITFRDNRIIPETSTIEIVFETRTIGGLEGTVKGYRFYGPLTNRLSVGLTLLEQISGGGGSETTTMFWTDNLLGDGTAGPYQLYHGPVVEGSEEIRVAGQPLQRDTDYTIDYEIGLIFFTQPVPLDENIVVTYQQVVEQAITGDRRVVGVDANYTIGSRFSVRYEWGKSNADADGNVGGGSASFLQTTFRLDRKGKRPGFRENFLTLTTTHKEVDPAFATIESASFRRNERGDSYDLVLTPWDPVRIHYFKDKTARPQGFSSMAGQVQDVTDFRNDTLGIMLDFPRLPTINWQKVKLQTTDQKDPHTVNTRQTTDTLTFGYSYEFPGGRWGTIELTGKAASTDARDLVSDTFARGSKSRSLNISYRKSENLRITTGLSSNSSESNVGRTSETTTRSWGVNYSPWDDLTLNARFSEEASTGTVTGVGGFGPPGGGFLQGSQRLFDAPSPLGSLSAPRFWPSSSRQEDGDGEDSGTRGTRRTSKTLGATWTSPSRKLTLTATLDTRYEDLTFTSNSDSRSTTLTAWWRPSEKLSVSASTNRHTLAYVGEEGSLSSRTVAFSLTYGPVRKFTADLSYMSSDSDSTFEFPGMPVAGTAGAFASKSYSLTLRRPLSEKISASVQFSFLSSGGLQEYEKNETEIKAVYHITENVSFDVAAQMVDYKDLTGRGFSYSTKFMRADLSFQF